jgi:hypothetical protein
MFNFNYNRADRIGYALLNEGEATFSITGCASVDKQGNQLVTKKGLPCVQVFMIVEDNIGQTTRMTQYLTENMGQTIFALGQSIGVDIHNETGIFDEQILVGKCGKLIISHDQNGNELRNNIKEYLPAEEAAKPYNPFGA